MVKHGCTTVAGTQVMDLVLEMDVLCGCSASGGLIYFCFGSSLSHSVLPRGLRS